MNEPLNPHCGNGGRRRRCRRGAHPKPLSECCEDTAHIIIDNQNRQSIEMGLYVGARITVVTNATGSTNMVVAIGDSRYILNREAAAHITVK